MNSETKKLLPRWHSLERRGGLKRAQTTARVLWVIGLVLFVFLVFLVVYRVHPAFVASPAAAMGSVFAEVNALRNRVAQWPTFKNYIDWKRVEEDLRR